MPVFAEPLIESTRAVFQPESVDDCKGKTQAFRKSGQPVILRDPNHVILLCIETC